MLKLLFVSSLCVSHTSQFGSMFQFAQNNYQSPVGYATAPSNYQQYQPQQYTQQQQYVPQQQQYSPQQYAQPPPVYQPQPQPIYRQQAPLQQPVYIPQPQPIYRQPPPPVPQAQYIARPAPVPAIPHNNYTPQQAIQTPIQSYKPQQQQFVPQRPQTYARPQPRPQPQSYVKPAYVRPPPPPQGNSYAKPVAAPQEYVAPPPPAYVEPPAYVRPDPCFTNNHGYRCCDKDLESMMNDFQSPSAGGCNHQKLANQLQTQAQGQFNTSFESIVSPSEFEGHHQFIGNLMCKTKTKEGKIMLLYATPKPYTVQGAARPLTQDEIDARMWSSDYLEIKSI